MSKDETISLDCGEAISTEPGKLTRGRAVVEVIKRGIANSPQSLLDIASAGGRRILRYEPPPEPFNIRQPIHFIARDLVKRIEERNGGKIQFGHETYRDYRAVD